MNSNVQQIANLPNVAEASILQVDAQNHAHLELLKKGYKNLLGLEASIHGAGMASNGNLPNNEMLKEVLASIMTAGRDVISERGWGLPVGAKIPAFGGPVPVIRIHAHEEPEIVWALAQCRLMTDGAAISLWSPLNCPIKMFQTRKPYLDKNSFSRTWDFEEAGELLQV